MKEKEAINFLNQRIQDLSDPSFDPAIWTETTSELLRKIFPNSFERKIQSIKSINYLVLAPLTRPEIALNKRQRGIQKANQYIQSYIQEIDTYKLEVVRKKESNQNQTNPILALISNFYFWTVIIFVGGASLTLGKQWGSSKFDNEKLNYYNENIVLKAKNQTLIDSSKIKNLQIKELTDNIAKMKIIK